MLKQVHRTLTRALCAAIVITLTVVFLPYDGVRVRAEGEDFSYTVTAISGPKNGNVQLNERIPVMYGEPLVVRITGNKPFDLYVLQAGVVGRLYYSVDNISETVKTVTITANKRDSYDSSTVNFQLYFYDSDDNLLVVDDEITGCSFFFSSYSEQFHVKSISLDKESITLVKGKTYTLTPSIYPSKDPDGNNVNIKWESYNNNVASVSDDGTVTAINTGSTTIFVFPESALEPNASCYVTVVDSIPATSVTVTHEETSGGVISDGTLYMVSGKGSKLNAAIDPPDSTDRVSWTSSNESIVTVDENGNLTAAAKGTALITASAGTGSASMNVKVLDHVNAKNPNCEDDGNREYWVDSDGNKYTYSESDGVNTISDIVIRALGHDLTSHAAKAATCKEAGNIAFWGCGREGCGKYFSDAEGKNEITRDQTVIAVDKDAHKWDGGKVTRQATRHEAGVMTYTCTLDSSHTRTEEIPKITGENGYAFVTSDHKYTLRSGKTVEITVKRSSEDEKTCENFEELLIDGNIVSVSNYDKAPGSVRITLKSSYLDKLSKGTHSVRFNFIDGYAESTLKITSSGSGSTPSTGDDTSIPAMIGMALSFLASLAYIIFSVYSSKTGNVTLSIPRLSAAYIRSAPDTTDAVPSAEASAEQELEDIAFDDEFDDIS